MSMQSRREYLLVMHERYCAAVRRSEKSLIVDELVSNLGYHRKHAIRVLAHPPGKGPKRRGTRPIMYREALPAIRLAWQALNYPCAERLHPVLCATADDLARHGELVLTREAREQLSKISRSTLARRLARLTHPNVSLRNHRHPAPSSLLGQIPVETYAWNESRPGALQVDLVEHNGGHTSGQYAYTLDVVDIVSGWSRRRAVMGRGQRGVFQALDTIIREWPCRPWGLHSDNGSEFMNDHLARYTKQHGLAFTRSRPYRKNDNAHVEQRNRQFVRQVVGYDRYDSAAAVQWLNQVYATLDTYANLFLPTQKLVEKSRIASRIRKRHDTAKTPLCRLELMSALDQATSLSLRRLRDSINPLQLHRELNRLLSAEPRVALAGAVAAEY